MAFRDRTAMRYNSVGLFLTDSPAHKPKSKDTKFFNRIQSAGFSIDVQRQNVQQIGSEDFVDRKIVSNATINVDIEYLLTDGYEEKILGLNIAPPSVIYDKNQDEIPVDFTTSGTIYNDLQEDKSMFFMIGEEQFDLTGYGKKEGGFSGLDVISVGNCFVTNYSISASVGDFAKSSVSLTASDISYGCVGSGKGGFVWKQISDTLGALLLQIDDSDDDFVLFQDEGKILFEENLQTEELGGAKNPSMDLSKGGVESTSGFVFNPYLYHAPVSAIRPGGIFVRIKNIDVGGPVLSIDGGGICMEGEANIQSFDISVPFESENLGGFSSMHVFGRKMKYPQIGTISLSLLASAFTEGNFQDIFCDDGEYEIEIEMTNTCKASCLKRQPVEKHMHYSINNAKLDGYTTNFSVGGVATVDCSFSFGMSRNNGLFISGTHENYKLGYCDTFRLRPELV